MKNRPCGFLLLMLLLACRPAGSLPIQATEEPLFFREDWKEIPAATPVTQEHVVHPELVLSLHGLGREGIKKSYHPEIPNDPFYIWSGECMGNWALSLRHRTQQVDLTGQALVRWRARQSGFRQLRLLLKLADGTWLVSEEAQGPSDDWQVREFAPAALRWRTLNIATVTEGPWAQNPNLSQVEEIGFTDLMTGGKTPASSRLDWIEVFGRGVERRR